MTAPNKTSYGRRGKPTTNPKPAEGTVARSIRDLRDAGWTARTLAEKLGVSIRAVQFWEAGQRMPSPEATKAIRGLRRRRAGA